MINVVVIKLESELRVFDDRNTQAQDYMGESQVVRRDFNEKAKMLMATW